MQLMNSSCFTSHDVALLLPIRHHKLIQTHPTAKNIISVEKNHARELSWENYFLCASSGKWN